MCWLKEEYNSKAWRRCLSSGSEGRTRKALPLGSNEPGLGQVAESRAVLKSRAKSLDIFLPGDSGWCSQNPFIKWNQLARSPYCDLGTWTSIASFCSLCTHCVRLGNLTGRTGSCRVIFSSPKSLGSTTLTLPPMLSCTEYFLFSPPFFSLISHFENILLL